MLKVLIFLIICPCIAIAQSLTPCKNASAIMVTRNDTSQKSIYTKLNNYLHDLGYSIQSRDTNLMEVEGEKIISSKMNLLLYITAQVIGNEIWFAGAFDEAYGKSPLKFRVDLDPAKNTLWQEFDGIARGFGSKATYMVK